ncbi:hypothetical protein ACK8P5_13725 [Paenibacillus sp. EC2-1]|uniref:hypothetical protein n=1 Tax=Paenibacillus sp. EC2-1 TaxID=3388665 RepID=UPI003BEF0B57
MRLNMFFFSTSIIFSVIIIRLAVLQFMKGPELTDQESSGQIKNFPLQPIRGTKDILIYGTMGFIGVIHWSINLKGEVFFECQK